MPDPSGTDQTHALSTKLEEEFVAPLTTIRGALEILRDVPDLNPAEREKFVANALGACATLQQGVEGLAGTVYSAARKSGVVTVRTGTLEPTPGPYQDRMHMDADQTLFEIDFSGYEFTSTEEVNAFFDAIEAEIARAKVKWHFLVNVTNLSIWPEAWVAFAHRSKRVAVNFALATVRYVNEDATSQPADREVAVSREQALARLGREGMGHSRQPVTLDL